MTYISLAFVSINVLKISMKKMKKITIAQCDYKMCTQGH